MKKPFDTGDYKSSWHPSKRTHRPNGSLQRSHGVPVLFITDDDEGRQFPSAERDEGQQLKTCEVTRQRQMWQVIINKPARMTKDRTITGWRPLDRMLKYHENYRVSADTTWSTFDLRKMSSSSSAWRHHPALTFQTQVWWDTGQTGLRSFISDSGSCSKISENKNTDSTWKICWIGNFEFQMWKFVFEVKK